jgi:hypothetical protein
MSKGGFVSTLIDLDGQELTLIPMLQGYLTVLNFGALQNVELSSGGATANAFTANPIRL